MARDIRAFMVSQAANIESAVYEAQFENIQYPRLVPVVTEGNPWALAVERRTIEKGTGEAKRLSHLGDDWPNVDSLYGRLSVNVGTYGDSYEVAEDDAQVAMMGGFDLSADKAPPGASARRGEAGRTRSRWRFGPRHRQVLRHVHRFHGGLDGLDAQDLAGQDRERRADGRGGTT